jgi:5-deoxy-glucuronate isomerase
VELLKRAGEWERVTPEGAGWRYLSFGIERLAGREQRHTGGEETAIVLLSGRCSVETGGETFALGPRAGVFEELPWTLYLPRDTAFTIEGEAELAVASCPCDRRREPVLQRPDEVEVEIRGAGNVTRQINNMIQPGFPAERILIVEVYTPAGSWSSYPPHKHDEERGDDEAVLEETYYFRTRSEPPGAFAVQRLYSPRHGLDLTETVRNDDLLLVPYGYHTTAAAHGYDLYYLNALAGDRRTMQSADDPDLAWIRPAWTTLQPDPRVPMVE